MYLLPARCPPHPSERLAALLAYGYGLRALPCPTPRTETTRRAWFDGWNARMARWRYEQEYGGMDMEAGRKAA